MPMASLMRRLCWKVCNSIEFSSLLTQRTHIHQQHCAGRVQQGADGLLDVSAVLEGLHGTFEVSFMLQTIPMLPSVSAPSGLSRVPVSSMMLSSLLSNLPAEPI